MPAIETELAEIVSALLLLHSLDFLALMASSSSALSHSNRPSDIWVSQSAQDLRADEVPDRISVYHGISMTLWLLFISSVAADWTEAPLIEDAACMCYLKALL